MQEFFETLIDGIKNFSFIKVWINRHYQTKQLEMLLNSGVKQADLSEGSVTFKR